MIKMKTIKPRREENVAQPSEWTGRPFPLIIRPDDLPRMQALFAKVQDRNRVEILASEVLSR